jgi:CubicO group peptidase (beta-lactamase class C family)
MEDLTVTPSRFDFGPVHAALRRHVDSELLPGVSHAVLRGRDLIDVGCFGWADRELHRRIEIDTVFRVFSNTKLVTSCAVMLLVEEDRIHLDDSIEQYLPQLANRVVLRPGTTSLDDVEPARGPKLTAGGGIASPHSPLDVSTFTEEELRAAVQAAGDWGTYVTVHA